jgi:hypothetical protein
MFADDAKLYKHILTDSDHLVLLDMCQNMFEWCKQSLMNLNINKCKVLSICRNAKNSQLFEYGFQSVASSGEQLFIALEHVDSMCDLGISVSSNLNFTQHIHDKVNKAYQMLGIIKSNFVGIDSDVFLLLYKSFVRSQLEYNAVVFYPYLKGLIFEMEKVQKRATKSLVHLKKLSYKERLKNLKLPTLKYRRARGDMIQVYKILHGIYDSSVAPLLSVNSDTRTRGNSYKLNHTYSRHDQRKYSFSMRVVGVWNNLPDVVVCSASINIFKNNLDKFWAKEDFLYDWEALIPGADY